MSVFDINGNEINRTKSHAVDNPNLADPANFTVGLLNADGTINTAQTSCATTDYIPCTAGKLVCAGQIISANRNPWYLCTSFKEVTRARVFYDSDKAVISGASENYYSDNNVMTGVLAPSGTAFVRVSFGGSYAPSNPVSNKESCFVHIADTAYSHPTLYFPNGVETLIADDSQLWDKWGKTWTLFGDSLTDSYGGHGWDMSTSPVGGPGWKNAADPMAVESRVPWTGYFWCSAIARELGLIVDNRGKSGSNINIGNNGSYADVCGVNILDTFLAEITNGATPPDFITIGFGTNNIASQVGTDADDSTVKTSTYGATKYFIEKIREKCPYTSLGFVLPPPGDWTGVSTVKDIDSARNAIKTVCESYKVPYVDMNDCANITVDMLPDKIHVSSKEANAAYMHAMRAFMAKL